MNRNVPPPHCVVRTGTAFRLLRSASTVPYLAAASAIALVLGACTSDDPTSTPTMPTSDPPLTAPNATPAPTPTVLPTEEAEAHARAAVEEYLAVFDEISADPSRDMTALEQVASGRALDFAAHQITTWRDAGYTGVGAQVASDFVITAADVDPDGETDYPTVALTACVDLSDTDLIDEEGNSVVPADVPDRVLVDYVVANVGWPDDQQWRVVRDDDQLSDSDPPEFVPCP